MTRFFPLFILASVLVSCTGGATLTDEEVSLINDSPEVMRVVKTDVEADSLFLRGQCIELSAEDIASEEFATLSRKMVATLVAPENNGVGIAGPQVGLRRRIVAVQRFDKEGEPIEVYANPYIVETRGEKESGPEGCLSVPDRRGDVMRWRDITITYTDPVSFEVVREDVSGFTSVIFQHEIDHLDGVLYIDRL